MITIEQDTSNLNWIDTHNHCFDTVFDDDRAQVIRQDRAAGVHKMILPGIDSSSHRELLSLVADYPEVCFPAIGLHPTAVNDCQGCYYNELELVEARLSDAKYRFVAVGEIGLDLYWSKDFLKQQKEAFAYQLQLSRRFDLPVIIHTRDAYEPIIEMLRTEKEIRGVFHAFSGTIADYRAIKSCGDFLFGIGGVLTYKKSLLPDIVRQIPLEEMVLETDAPYLAPVPYRGKRNQAAYIPIIGAALASIKQVDLDQVACVTTNNAEKMFHL